ncbi:glycoside hydrolase family 6 protein [Actinoplanes utahensis]|uniref:Glucanase n=1 Tax=Actinoplanes utahensis TaxID=1869 RepID=A0A0A6UX49_ACTUT|nr:glycoside hydrolase family 6 protein [Actinoplanes utahensis]KHD78999.1 endoglucanase [Actinoplanes utahensis]GIF28003.1 glucanase [Actinoplanes utahensis]
MAWHRNRSRLALTLAALLGVTAGGLLLRDPAAPAPIVVPPPTPATALYVDPNGLAQRHVRALRSAGRHREAAALQPIAGQPAATWFTDARAGFADRARHLVATANAAGRLPVLTLYFIPHRDCRGYSSGGARGGPAYRRWISSMAAALRGHRALVILEPDAVAHAASGCLGPRATATRFALLAHAIDTLRAQPGVAVYLDAGHPGWVPAARMAPALRRAGAPRARGFALNVANFETTADNVRYGTTLSRLLGGRHFVIDTSRNGWGPLRLAKGVRRWCNPPGRRLGATPTLRTGLPLVDAYLWVKRPGESDGACGAGAPPAGQWYPAYARALTGS